MNKVLLRFSFLSFLFNVVITFYFAKDINFLKNTDKKDGFSENQKDKLIEFENNYQTNIPHLITKKNFISRVKKAAISNSEHLWEKGIIPYLIEKELFDDEQLGVLKLAMLHWENYTCLKFVEKRPYDFDYVYFTEKSCKCCSDVGKKGNGKQIVSLSKPCLKFGTIVHELGHVIGFWHEHTRPDRDYNVNIIRNNISPGQEHNFDKLKSDETNSLGSPYDFDSIMHYSKNTFSKNYFLETIKPKYNINVLMGQRTRLSKEDIKQTNNLYQCRNGKTLINSQGLLNISLSNLKQNYHLKNFSYEWRIVASQSQRISIFIKKLRVESYSFLNCASNYLIILDGYQSNSPTLKKICFDESINTSLNLISETNRLLIIFKTENKNAFSYLIFNAYYEFICGDIIFQKEGFIESPNYPLNYPPNTNCTWILKGEKNHSFILEIKRFNLEYEKNCLNDYLEIREGFDETGQLINILCGEKVPIIIQTKTNILFLKFSSNSKNEKSGFALYFTNDFNECENNQNNCEHICVNTANKFYCECYNGYELSENNYSCEKTCGETITVENSGLIKSPNYPNNYPNNKICKWNLHIPRNYSLFLNFSYFDLESNNLFCYSDTLTLRTKGSEKDDLFEISKFCGNQLPEIDIEFKNFVQLEFKSDKSVVKKGFLLKYELDYDDCSKNNGNCDQICVKKLNTYECKCKKDYQFLNGSCSKIPCSYVLKNPKGIIQSIDDLNEDNFNSNCTWKIETFPGHVVKIKFFFENFKNKFCLQNNLLVYDGPTILDSVFSVSELINNKTLTSRQNFIFIFFNKNSECQLKFKVKYKSICGGNYLANNQKQIIYSHYGFGNSNYKSLTNCDWIIKSERNKKIKLTFLFFDLEYEKNCSFDYLKIYESQLTNSSYIFCGDQTPKEIISYSNHLFLKFFTDKIKNSLGFKLAFEEFN